MLKHDNIIKKIYPKPSNNNYDNLDYDNEGLWSITQPFEATLITKNIIRILDSLNGINIINDIITKKYKILDMTGGCGGNTISFCEYFNMVICVENNIERFNILDKNLKCYDYNNYILHCNDSIQLIDNTFDAFFIDPPWGGPDYKKQNNLKLQLSNIDMVDMVKLIPSNKLIILKLPFNHYIDDITKHYKLLYKLEIKNILVLYLINTIIE